MRNDERMSNAPEDDRKDPAMPTEDAYAPGPSSAKRRASGDPVADLKQGFGLLIRAARTATQQLPTDRIEGAVREASREVERAARSIPTASLEAAVRLGVASVEAAAKRVPTERVTGAVVSSAREVGRALESVAEAVERTVTGKPSVRVEPEDGAGRGDSGER